MRAEPPADGPVTLAFVAKRAGVSERTVFQHFLHVPFPGPAAWAALTRLLVAGSPPMAA